ncbi:MAG TPA: J domain-containing protein [Bacillota bacterium]|nr:J domain-containing protein [Bacillota bacterium]
MAKGAIHRVWADYDATYGGRRGIMIHASMAVTERRSAQSEQVLLIYWFYYTDGKPVPGASGEFTDSGGNACVYEGVDTPYPSTEYDDFSVFVPYEALSHQGSGSFSAYANAALFEGNSVIAWAPRVLSFTLTIRDVHGPQPHGQPRPKSTPKTTTATTPNTGGSGGGGRSFDSQTPAQRYRQMFGIPPGASPAQIKQILDREYQKYRARVNSPDLSARQEADRMIMEIGKARRVLLPQ